MVTKNELKKAKSLHQKKTRLLEQSFFVEGEKAIREFLDSSFKLKVLYTQTPTVFADYNSVIPINTLELKQISALKNPSGHFAIFSLPQPQPIHFQGYLVGLDAVRDPGNLGTIIRLCDWFGIKNIICSKNSVDCYNPKVVQSSMGSISRVSISYMEFDNLISSVSYNTVAADLHGKSLKEHRFSKNQIIFFGNESNGFSQKVSSNIKTKITIQRYNDNVESLNLASSVAIVLSELKNQIIGK